MADLLEGMAWRNIIRISSENDQQFANYVLEARSQFLGLALRQDKAVKQIYLDAAANVSRELKAILPDTPGRQLRARYLKQLEKSLRAEADRIRVALEQQLKTGIQQAVSLGADPLMKQLGRCLADAGADFSWLKLQRGFAEVNAHAVETFWARTRGGIFLSDRIWLESEKARRAISAVVQDGIARGLDAVKVARQVEQYLKVKTPVTEFRNMMQRMGPGRIPKNLTYEALRMARTEIAIAHMEGLYAAGKVTPGYLGVVWCLSASHPMRDECDDLAEADLYGMGAGVYPAGEEPVIPHPNCLCFVVPKVEATDALVNRLRQWAQKPGNDAQLDKWYNDIYGGLVGRAVAGLVKAALPGVTAAPQAKTALSGGPGVAGPAQAAEPTPIAPPPPGSSKDNPIHVDNWQRLGHGASNPYTGTVDFKKYLFKPTSVPLGFMQRNNLEAEILASKVFNHVGLKTPACDFAWFEANGDVHQYLRVEWAERTVSAYDFRIARGYQAVRKVPFQRMQVIDVLLANTDRHEGNFLFYLDGTVVPIDHNLTCATGAVITGGYTPPFRDDMLEAEDIVSGILSLNPTGQAIITDLGVDAYKPLIRDVQARLTDADIHKIVEELPDELAEPWRKSELERILLWRRDHLEDLFEAVRNVFRY